MRTLTITEALVREYSRRGNYHSDAESAAALGLPGLVAQGMQAAGPAYAELLDTWGEEFLAHGQIDLRFVGPVYARRHRRLDGRVLRRRGIRDRVEQDDGCDRGRRRRRVLEATVRELDRITPAIRRGVRCGPRRCTPAGAFRLRRR